MNHQLIQHLSSNANQVQRLNIKKVFALNASMILLFFLVVLGIRIFSANLFVFENFLELSSDVLLLAVALLGTWYSINSIMPGRVKNVSKIAIWLCLGLLLAFFVLFLSSNELLYTSYSFHSDELICSAEIFLISTYFFIAFLSSIRRFKLIDPPLTFAFGSIAGVSAGSLFQHVGCSLNDVNHLLMGHFGSSFLVTLLALSVVLFCSNSSHVNASDISL